jgi:hypothetical protein
MSETRKIYCGNKEELPPSYTEFGSRYTCLKRGVGIGLYVIPKDKQFKRDVPDDSIQRIATRLAIPLNTGARMKNRNELIQEIIEILKDL